ncbi:uncharacterized protein LOC131937544 isoform X2 [Physella acuta]|uniref:uncharacterized protein LOC131937544 isoform X2 n=1 Tax=Physella acuta TaxID=109671 RepID=UPI0027DB13EF|nr:uncharacterized protein LOC131937544 isoform X2 [Physella acuta]
METKNIQTYFVRNIEDGQTVSLSGEGEFCIGLTQSECIACLSKSQPATASHHEEDIVVPLMIITVWKTSGVTVSPASRDLKCHLNGADIGSEANIIPGNQIEVGDKILELLDGVAAKPQRRHLPLTPGVPVHPTPPPKPQRSVNGSKCFSPDSETQVKDIGRDALREWCLGQLPATENELLEKAKSPEQLANLAASYLTRHINLHTDVVVSTELTDRIFKMMQEVAHHRKDILRRFLQEVINEVVSEEKDNREKTDNIQHSTVTTVLVEILRQFLDPGYLVLICLQLLRALSHIPGNVKTMVTSHTTAAVLGSMAVYKEDAVVQNNCLDILAKMATYVPAVLEKPPMKESTIDLVVMAMTMHSKNLTVVQAGIRTLANLASSLHSLSFASMKRSPYQELRNYVTTVISVLEYLYSNTLAHVRNALGVFCADLTVKTDGRRFLFEYAKMEQLKSQKKLWELMPDVPIRNKDTRSKSEISEDNVDSGNENDNEAEDMKNECDGNNSTSGILKRSRSFENLRNPDRRVSFVEESDLASFSDGSSSSESSHGSPSTVMKDGSDSPDIQVLSRSIIYPTRATSDSVESEVAVYDSQSDLEQTLTPAKPTRRPILVPLVHINSQSDSDADVFVDSPSVTSCKDKDSPTVITPSLRYSQTPVDLTDFRFTAADVIFMKRLMSVQVTCHVCSASVQGQNPKVLKLLDMPLMELLSQPGIPNAVWQFASCQFDEGATLMDIDPAAVIAIIDAVRYKMLAFDLVKKSLQLLVQSLTLKLHTKMFAITEEVFASVLRDTTLSSILSDEDFVSSIEVDLHKFKESVCHPSSVTPHVENLNLLVRRTQLDD